MSTVVVALFVFVAYFSGSVKNARRDSGNSTIKARVSVERAAAGEISCLKTCSARALYVVYEHLSSASYSPRLATGAKTTTTALENVLSHSDGYDVMPPAFLPIRTSIRCRVS